MVYLMREIRILAVSGSLIAICALPKYYGISLLILLRDYGFGKNPKIGPC